jgi:hypothetical protein
MMSNLIKKYINKKESIMGNAGERCIINGRTEQ